MGTIQLWLFMIHATACVSAGNVFVKITLAYITNEIEVISPQNDTQWGDTFIIHNSMWMASLIIYFRLPFQAAGSVHNHIILIFISICHQGAEAGYIESQFFIQWNTILYTTHQWQRKDMMRICKRELLKFILEMFLCAWFIQNNQ